MYTTLFIGTPNALTIIENIIGIPVAFYLQQSWIRISPVSGTITINDIHFITELMYNFLKYLS